MALLFFDDFDYAIARGDTNVGAAFISNGGWDACRTEQDESGANIYFYTVDSIPGFAGTFPGGGSRVLAMEYKGADEDQADAYFQIGTGVSENIPSNAWFQYWIYIQNHAGSGQESLWHNQNKWFYLTNDVYPSHSHRWMLSHSSGRYSNLSGEAGGNWPNGDPSIQPFMILSSSAGLSTIDYTGPGSDPEAADTLGPQTTAEALVANRWTLVKINVDTSTMTPRYRCWMRAQADPDFTQICDWQHGVNGLSWTYDDPGGHIALRWPSTLGAVPPAENYDSWTYVADFAMADAEGDLPTYGDATARGAAPIFLAGLL